MGKYRPPPSKQQTNVQVCRTCGELAEWRKTPDGWRLFEIGKPKEFHLCGKEK